MRKVFADTLYWIAIVRPDDPYAAAAKDAQGAAGQCMLVTTDEIIDEFVTAVARGGPKLRAKAVEIARAILNHAGVTVVMQSRDSLLSALDRYSRRLDKACSLTDCAAMNAMDAEGITEVLTNDHHFAQAGYRVLMASSARGDA